MVKCGVLSEENCQRLFDEGMDLFRKGRYAEAMNYFMDAEYGSFFKPGGKKICKKSDLYTSISKAKMIISKPGSISMSIYNELGILSEEINKAKKNFDYLVKESMLQGAEANLVERIIDSLVTDDEEYTIHLEGQYINELVAKRRSQSRDTKILEDLSAHNYLSLISKPSKKMKKSE